MSELSTETGRPGGSVSVVRHAVARFATRSVVAMLLLAIGTVFVSQHIARDVALEDATYRSGAIARGLSGVIDERVRSGDPSARARISHALAPALHNRTMSHIKLWAEDGTVIWADDKSLVDRKYELEPDVASLFGTENVSADLSNLEKPENAHERAYGQLVEVYVGAFDSDGRPWVFEAYLSTDAMERNQSAIVAGMLPLALGALLLFLLMVLPLALSLAKRVQRAQVERGKLLRHALLASELERRRIAQDLHDGVIQDLAGLNLALPLVRSQLPTTEGTAAARRALDQVSGVLAKDVPALRSMLTDVYPPNLAHEGLILAVEDLAMRAEEAGLAVTVHVSEGFDAPLEANRLAYRVVREGLRNAVSHAPGSTVLVYLLRSGMDVVVRVVDDGPGVAEGSEPEEGHLGLRLLEDTVRDLGGRFDLSSAAAGGAILETVFPADLVTS